MSFRAGICVLVALFVATIFSIDQYEKYNSYVVTDSRVTSVEEQCYMKKVDGFFFYKQTKISGLIKCPVAELLVNSHPEWKGSTIYHKIMISSNYTSPVDHQPHISTIEYSEFPNGHELRAGEKLTIRASKFVGDKTRAL